ncbi:hypothetical protein FCV25MIE_16094 [Fagus crenata]
MSLRDGVRIEVGGSPLPQYPPPQNQHYWLRQLSVVLDQNLGVLKSCHPCSLLFRPLPRHRVPCVSFFSNPSDPCEELPKVILRCTSIIFDYMGLAPFVFRCGW